LTQSLGKKTKTYAGASGYKVSPITSNSARSSRAPAPHALNAWSGRSHSNYYHGLPYRRPYFYGPYFYGPVFIHPVPAPLPPISVSLLVRILKTAPIDPIRSFDAVDLLMRLEPLIQRKPSA
jgi:hypothetical protein